MPRKIQLWSWRKTDLYIDSRDWWVGVFLDENYTYICPLPCVVVRRIREVRGAPLPPGSLPDPYGTEGW
jgi:hypothetical protein